MAGNAQDSSAVARVPALDGLRGLAVLAVLAFHGQLAVASGGFLGVSAFFTLSGFLITSLLVLEWERHGRINVLRFWARRARRLLPAALVALVGIAAYGAWVATGHEAQRIGGDGLSALAYVANWRFVVGDQSYAALFSSPSPVQHFWSLAIEEQFYLLFPLLLIGAFTFVRTRVGVRRILIGLTLASIALGFLLWSPGHDPARVYYGTDTRAAELLIGAVLATVLAGRRHRSRMPSRRIAKSCAGTSALLVLVVMWTTSNQSATWLYRGGFAVHAVLTAFVIAAALQPGPVAWILSVRPLRALGLISYGVYLYHWPIFLWLDAARLGINGAPLFFVRSAVTLAVATASYRWIEQPIRTGHAITGPRPRWLIPVSAAAVAGLLVAATAGASEPIVFAAVQHTSTRVAAARPAAAHPPATVDLPLTGPTPPAAPAPPVRRILIVGDSVALTLGRGIERWGAAHGVEVMNAGRPFCPIARGGRLAASFGNAVSACENWPTLWPQQLAEFHPDVVLVLTTVWDLSKRQRDEWGPDFLAPGDPEFDTYVQSEWSEAVHVLSSTGARVGWLITPCARDELGDAPVRYARHHYLGAVRAAGATTIDLGAFVCPDGRFTDTLQGVSNLRPDGLHFSDPGADVVAGWLGPIAVDPTMGRPPTPPSATRPPRRSTKPSELAAIAHR